MHVIVLVVCLLSVIHLLLGATAVLAGVIMSIQADVWIAHTVCPLWSGAVYIITGIIGMASSNRKTSYVTLCFGAFNIVCLFTAVVSIQLLRLGLVNHTTDGQVFQKKDQDMMIYVSIGISGSECLINLISLLATWLLWVAIKHDVFKKREGTFHVEIRGEKDIVVISRPPSNESRSSRSPLMPTHL